MDDRIERYSQLLAAAEARSRALMECLDQIEDESGAWGDMTGTEQEFVRRLRAVFGVEMDRPGLPDLRTIPPETRTFMLPGIGHCAECGAVVTEHEAIIAYDARAAAVSVAMRPVVKPGTNRPCGHQAQYVVTPESPAIEAT